MGAKNRNTLRAKQQVELDGLRSQITMWYIDEKLTSTDIQAKLKAYGLDLTVGQVHYAFHRFELVRPRNTMTTKHLASLRARTHPMKVCRFCKESYEPSSGHQVYCSTCVKTPSDIRRIKNYGVNRVIFDQMLVEQQGICDICKEKLHPDEAAVDHDHATGRVRGLLCRRCNLKLVVVEDEVFTTNAQTYLLCSKARTYGKMRHT